MVAHSKKRKTNKKKIPHRPTSGGKFFLVGLVLVLVTFAVLSTVGEKGILHLFRLKNLYQSLQTENQQQLEEQAEMLAEVARLEDPKYMEYLAKEKLGLLRPKEFFIILDPPKTNSVVDNDSSDNVPQDRP